MRKITALILTVLLCFSLVSFSVSAESYPIETYFSKGGVYDIDTASFDSGVFIYGQYKAWYPSDMVSSDKKYPVIVYCNGTSTTDSVSYTEELMSFLASWGFIMLSNDHAMSGNGDSASAELDFFLKLNEQENSLFYQKLDTDKIGICGHSQGGSGAINGASVGKYENSAMFRSVCAISAPYSGLAASLVQNSPYDASKVTVPSFLYAGTESLELGICPLEESLIANMRSINNDNVVIGRITGADHLDTQSEGKAYINAWFHWTLLGDNFAAGAFSGDNPELFRNEKWQDVCSKTTYTPPENTEPSEPTPETTAPENDETQPSDPEPDKDNPFPVEKIQNIKDVFVGLIRSLIEKSVLFFKTVVMGTRFN